MEIEEVMAPVVDDMETTIRRFAGRIELWEKFLLKFKDDLTYTELQTAYELSDGPAMERAAHTMKGIAANLGLQRLSDASADMVRSVRCLLYTSSSFARAVFCCSPPLRS